MILITTSLGSFIVGDIEEIESQDEGIVAAVWSEVIKCVMVSISEEDESHEKTKWFGPKRGHITVRKRLADIA